MLRGATAKAAQARPKPGQPVAPASRPARSRSRSPRASGSAGSAGDRAASGASDRATSGADAVHPRAPRANGAEEFLAHGTAYVKGTRLVNILFGQLRHVFDGLWWESTITNALFAMWKDAKKDLQDKLGPEKLSSQPPRLMAASGAQNEPPRPWTTNSAQVDRATTARVGEEYADSVYEIKGKVSFYQGEFRVWQEQPERWQCYGLDWFYKARDW